MQQAPSIYIPAPPPAVATAIPRSSVSWLLVVTIMGYAPIGLLGSFIGYSVSPYFRALEVLLSVYVFLRYLPGPHTWGRHLWLHAFLGLYLLRLLFDTVIGAPGDPATSLVFFLAVVVGPTLALSGVRPGNIDWDATAWRLVLVSAITCIGAILMFQLGVDERALESGRLEAERLNTITIGHTAVTGLLAALYLVQRRGWWRRILLTAAGALCAQALLMSASRGPMVALGVCLAVYVVATRRFFWPLLLVVVGGFLLFSQEDSILLARFLLLVQDQGTYDLSAVERLEFQARSWEQFLGSPFLGSGFAERVSGTYPHNILIETLMALGVIGGLLMTAVIVRATRCSYAMLRDRMILPVLLLVQYFVNGQISGSIWGSDAMWALTAVVLAYGAKRAQTSRAGLRSASGTTPWSPSSYTR